MPPISVIGFLVADVAFLVTFIILVVCAFRTRLAWGFIVLFAPFGIVVFSIKHWSDYGKIFVLMLICAGACGALMFTSPPLIAGQIHRNPEFASLVKTLNPQAYADAQKLIDARVNPSGSQPGAKPTPHEVRDLAENETTVTATPPPDPNAAPRAVCAKHAKELNTLYQQLNAERPKLKPGSPAVAAFNAKAARYQQGLQALNEEKSRLDALDHASNLNAEAAAAPASLQASAQAGDYEAFASTLKRSLTDCRQTPAFPQIVAVARPLLQQATPDKVLAGLQNKAASTARAEFDKTTKKVQGIVNQAPQIVTPPPGSTEVFKYSYHPGAEKPNYSADNLIGTREIWHGDYAYVEGAPNVFYRSADCEFNPQTKYFYLSRTVAKKRLTDAEYAELTRLYHQLGEQEKAIAETPAPTRDAERVSAQLDDLKKEFDGYAMK